MDSKTTLDGLPLGQGGYISSANASEGIKRRLLEYGFSTGNYVTPLFISPMGDPIAYKIMGSVVALRKDTASKIVVTPALSEKKEVPYCE